MNRKVILLAALLAAVVGVWLLVRSRGEHGTKGKQRTDEEILAQRRDDRQRGKVDTRPSSVAGSVIDLDTGKGIAGALVSITERSLDGGARGQPGVSPEPITAVTDAAGAFRVDSLTAGRYSLAATAPGYTPDLIDPVDLAPGEERSDVALRLRKGGNALSGTITDIGGGPIAGAHIRARRGFEGSIIAMFRAPFTTTSDSNGRYSIQLLDGSYEVSVSHGDYVETKRNIEIHGEPRVEHFRLVPGGVIEGKVIARATGEPVPGALVTEANEELRISGVALEGAVRTDDQGRFMLRGLSSGAIQLQAVGRGFSTQEPTLVELGIGEHATDVVIYVDPAFTISGFVVNKRDREKAISGVIVGAYNIKPGAVLLSTDPTADDGYFEILGVPPGNYVVGALGEQRVPTIVGPSVTIKDRDVEDVLIELDDGVIVSGRVEPAGVAEISVSVGAEAFSLNFAPMVSAALARTTSDETGQFELRGLAKGEFKLRAETASGREGSAAIVIGDSDVRDVLIRLEERAAVSGVVVDASGAPVQNASVQISPKKAGEMRIGPEMWNNTGALTRADGTFEELGFEPGTHEVSVEINRQTLAWAAPGQAAEPNRPLEIEIVGTTPIIGLRLVVEARNKQLRGVVLQPDGSPAADAWVTARYWSAQDWERRMKKIAGAGAGGGGEPEASDDPDKPGERTMTVTVSVGGDETGASAETSDSKNWKDRARRNTPGEEPVLTGEDGRFTIGGLREGNYDLEATTARGSASGRVEDVHVGSDVVIRMDSLATVKGVVRRGGEPVTQYSAVLEGPIHRRRAVANPEGRFEFGRVEPGSYALRVTADDGRAGTTIAVKPNATVEQNLDLVDYGSVTGTVVDAQTGKPMSGYPVMAFNEGGDMSEMFNLFTGGGPRTDKEGRFRIGHLGAGKGALIVMDGDRNAMAPLATKDFELRDGQELDLGTLQAASADTVPRAERGDYGLVASVATWKERPGLRGKDKTALPAGIEADTQLLWVGEVTADRPAAEAGLEVGDRIVAIDGIDMATAGASLGPTLLSSLRTRAGDTRTIVYERAGKQTTATLTAERLPE